MQYIKLGQSDLTVSRICMGVMAQNTPATKDNKQVWSR